jgi:two-component system, NtrC family, response regulator AtoC
MVPLSKTTVDASVTFSGASDAPRFLLVTAQGGLRVFPLPEGGEVLVGRGSDCQISLDHPKVSRHHVRLRLGAACTICDLGSRNGTQYRGQRLGENEVREVGIGESFGVGPFSLVLMPPGAAPLGAAAGGSSLRVDDPAASASSALLTAVARAPVSVVIGGETGVGKEVLAATLHRLSGRKGPFLAVNCAALNDSLLESELFGHERGAFTGAVQAKPGLLEAAGGGTLFLDEVGEMAPALQAKLLRAIEAREVLRVGATKPVAIDVRFLAATHRDLLATEGLRRDLYYRLAGITLSIPPLRERRERVGALAVELLGHAAARGGVPAPTIAADATAKLMAHDWPGNVRELRNVIDRALLLAAGGPIRPEHLMFDAAPPPAPAAAPAPRPVAPPPAAEAGDPERDRILAALDACAGNQTRAARELGMSRATLVNKLAIHRIPRPRKK